MMKRLSSILAVLLVILLVAGCAAKTDTTAQTNEQTTQTQAPEAKTTLNIAINRDITSLDGSGGGFSSTTVSMHIYDCLVRVNESMEPEPALATQWEMVDDLTWKFTLREGVKFHDGSDFNAESVAFSISHYTDAIKYKYLTQWGQAWSPSCEVVDDYTVLIKTQAPQPAVPRLLSRLPMLPVDYAGHTVEEFFAAPVGTGAYKFGAWDNGICITLQANEDYWDGAPAIKTLNYYTVSDDNARMAGFKVGEYDIVYGVPYDQVEEIQNTAGLKVMQKETIGYDAIQFNFRVREGSPIGDLKIRQAMTYAIDHKGICDVIMNGYQSPAAGPAPLSVFGAYDGGGFPARDIEKAKQLMSEAGYQGEEIRFVFHSGEFTSDLEVSELVLAQLQEVGFNVVFEQVESGAWSDLKGTDQWDLTNNSVPGSFSGEAQYHYNQMKNLTGLYIEEFEDIINAADWDTAQSQEERAADISAAMKVLWDYVPYAFGTVPVSSIGMVEGLEGYKYIPLNWLLLGGASFAS